MKTKHKVTMCSFLAAVLLTVPLVSWAGNTDAAATVAENSLVQDQKRLESKIRHELVMLPYFSVFDHLAFQLNGNELQLIGQVTSPGLKNAAGRIVQGIEGISTVINHIEVLPNSPNDDQIRLRGLSSPLQSRQSPVSLQPGGLRCHWYHCEKG